VASVFVISGPSGAGKGTIIALVLDSLDRLSRSISATTRAPRAGEVDGVHYHFLEHAEFEARVASGAFLEWVEYGDNLYGTLRSDVEGRLAEGNDVILEIELRGARAVRRAMPEAALVFIAPPSMAELAERLRRRATDSSTAIATRLAIAETELAAAEEFDLVVVNDVAERAAGEVTGFIARRRKGA
jgi:guanylate kinase